MKDKILKEMAVAEQKAWDSLARYKFYMFGYWAAQWVNLNRLSETKTPNPFKEVVKFARDNNKKPIYGPFA